MIKLLENTNVIVIIIVLVVSLFILSKSADLLVDHAVKLSKLWGLPELVIGATIVSLGTTLPELSASVASAVQGNASFALGNAVGSIITNTSLIIGIGALFGKIPVNRKASQKLSLLIAAVFLLILPTFPYKAMGKEGLIPRWMGVLFLILIPVYIIFLLRQEKNLDKNDSEVLLVEKDSEQTDKLARDPRIVMISLLMIIAAAAFIAISSSGLVSSAEVLASRIGIPDVVIASTLVAFGTSVPELSTCITAAKKNYGGLALGNIMGANILNILMVVGAASALSPNGISIAQEFYNVHFIALGIIISFFGFFAYNSRYDEISKKEGIMLIVIYSIFLGANLFIGLGK